MEWVIGFIVVFFILTCILGGSAAVALGKYL